MNNISEEFVASLRALLKRYNVSVEKGFSGLDDDHEVMWTFSNDVELAKDEINLTMDEIHKELVKQ